MSGKDRFSSGTGPMGRLMDKIKRTVSTEVDDTRDPLHRGYSRVETAEGSLSNSSTSTSLDTVIIEKELSPLRQPTKQRSYSPILETEDVSTQLRNINSDISGLGGIGGDSKTSTLNINDAHKASKSSLKTSKVSFEENQFSSDEDNFEEKRDQFQKRKATSTAGSDHKGILKDLRHILATDDRKAFQSKKHVSLDIKNSKVLEKILNGSSSDEDFESNREHFQSRKHKSLDAKVKFNVDKDKEKSTSSSEDDYSNIEGKRLLYKHVVDFSKPVIIDFKELDVSDDEDFITARKNFQQQRQISTDSRKSHRFFEMDDMGSKKSENIRTAVPFVRQITEDGKPKLEVYRPTTNPIYIYTQILAALSVSLGSMVVGFSSGYTSPALPSMKNENITSFEVTAEAGSWIGGMMPLVGLVGGIAGGPMIEYLGRKNTILATAIPFIISWLLIACATSIGMVLAGRAISGFCVGIASLSLPVYLGETLQPEVRGTLGLLPTAFGNIGILLCFVAGRYMDWSMLAFLGGAIPIPFLLLMLLIPETPRWYVSRGRDDSARKALQWLRGKKADVEPELKGIIKTHTDSERHSSSSGTAELIKNLKPLAISLGLMFSQQFSGINAVIFYAGDIFGFAGTAVEESICVIIIGIVNFGAVFMATVLIDRLGRKMLLYISSVAMIATLAILGGYFIAKDNNADVSGISWLPLFSLMVYVLGFSLGFGPIPWLMMGEILPAKIRGKAASVATAFNWTCTFVVTKTFANMITSFGLGGAFLFYGCICVAALVFVITCVPETQGKSLEDIERKMMGRVRRMSSVANIKPLSFNM